MPMQTRYLPALGRLLIAVIFVFAGFGKIMSPGHTQDYIAAAGLPAPMLAYLAAVLVEFGGGLLLLVGFQTRPVAAILAIFCVVTAVLFHNDFANQNMMIHFMKNLAMAGGLLQVVAFGPGSLSIDAWRHPALGARIAA